MQESIAKNLSVCAHCGTPVATGVDFCCRGCESVHALLQAKGLSHFYTLKEQFPLPAPKLPAPVVATETASLEALQGRKEARFYLEGIQCLGCLWLLEKLPELDTRIEAAKLDVALQILSVRAKENSIDWNEVSTLLARLGYSAKALADEEGEKERRKDHRWQLARLGLAGFSAGNIMLLSVSIYAGADAIWGLRFGWLSLGLALPALTFSAWPIYRSAFLPLRRGKISVDLAISLALIAGFAMSFWSLLKGSEADLYFDSLTMLTFLLLSSRYLMSRFRESLAKESSCLSYLASEKYNRLSPEASAVTADAVRTGDTLEIHGGQTLPVDSVLLDAEAHFDLSLLTGESTPMKFAAGDRVDAGAKLCSDSASLKAAAPAKESRLAKIMEQIRSYELGRSPSIILADRIGRYFVSAVLLTALVILSFMPNEEGIRRALALVIVTCPCVLAFAIPLAFTRTMQIAAKKGVLFLAPEKIEALAAVRHLFFDKTGTLTTGQFSILEWNFFEGNESEIRSAVCALETHSSHPIAKSILRYLRSSFPAPIATSYAEIPGFGVTGIVQGKSWKIGGSRSEIANGKKIVDVWKEDKIVARIVLGDALRPDSKAQLQSLREMGVQTYLLSGDSEPNTAAIAADAGITYWRSGLLPGNKAEILSNSRDSAMVGDGANDAIAFKAAGLGIAVQGAVEISMKNADIVLTKPGIGSVLLALRLSRSALHIVKVNFLVTLAYNLVAGTLAVLGLMEPLWAAVLMPASALSVSALTQWQTQRKLA